MPSTPQPKYEFELWINNTLVADITGLCQNRRYKLRRNASEELDFIMNLTAFERKMENAGRNPLATLVPYVTDIRVKRNGQYMFGVHVVDAPANLNQGEINIEVKATGFLDLFEKRYITKTYTGEEATDIWRDAIVETQSGDATNDFGVEPGVTQETVGVNRDRTYVDQNVRDLLVNLTNLQDGNFDFRFNPDRSFDIFQQIGSNRPGNKFTYPYNIKGGKISRSAMNLYNQIIGLGSGFGEEALRTVQSDNDSRANYKTRQRIVTFNSVSVQETLDENTGAYLARVKELLMLPKIKTDGRFCDLGIVGIGDRIPIEVQGHPYLPIDDTYRIEEISVSLDENDAEDIDLTIDNFGLEEA